MIETLRSYMQLATGLLESTAERAKETATSFASQASDGPEVVSQQVQGIAEDLIEQGRTNRELLVGLVRTEVERTVGRMGFVREEELAAVRKHVERLERQLNERGDQAAEVAKTGVTVATSAVPATTKAAAAATAKATDTAVKASKAAAGTARTAARTAKSAAPKPAAKKAPVKKTAPKADS